MSQMLQLPTVPGLVDGIVSRDPWALQCRECGLVAVKPDNRRVSTFVILSGYRFHICERDTGESKRRCPDCLAAVEAACPNVGRHR